MDKINGISVFDTSNKYKELYEIECNLDLQSRELRIKYLEQWIIEKNKFTGHTQYNENRIPDTENMCLHSYERMCKNISKEKIINEAEIAIKNVYSIYIKNIKE